MKHHGWSDPEKRAERFDYLERKRKIRESLREIAGLVAPECELVITGRRTNSLWHNVPRLLCRLHDGRIEDLSIHPAYPYPALELVRVDANRRWVLPSTTQAMLGPAPRWGREWEMTVGLAELPRYVEHIAGLMLGYVQPPRAYLWTPLAADAVPPRERRYFEASGFIHDVLAPPAEPARVSYDTRPAVGGARG